MGIVTLLAVNAMIVGFWYVIETKYYDYLTPDPLCFKHYIIDYDSRGDL